MAARTRSWWGWGWEDEAVPDAEMRTLGSRLAERFGVELTIVDPPDLAGARPPPAADRAARRARRPMFVDSVRPGRAHLRQVVPRPRARASAATCPIPPTSSPSRDRRPTSSPCSTGARRRTSPRSPTAAARPSSAGSRATSATASPASCRSTSPASARCSRSTPSPVPPASRPGRSDRSLEAQLRPHGYTLRHFPQSFELSTLGGWLATRSGGHYASVYTHIDDFVESLRVVTPAGICESRRLPGSGAGPSPDRLFLGSEGSLGIITEAWMRVQDRPRWRASAGVVFDRYADGVEATRALAQSGLFPTNCRLLDGGEAAVAAGTSGVGALLVLGFESADHPGRRVDGAGGRALPRPPRHDPGRRQHVRRGRQQPALAGRLGRFVAVVVPPRALPAQRPRALRHDPRDVRDGVPVERVRGAPRRGHGDGDRRPAADLRRGLDDVPVHPRLPRRPGPVLQHHRPRAAGIRARDVGRDQGRRGGGRARPTAGRSRTTTPSAATTIRGTGCSGPRSSGAPSTRPRPSSTRPACSIPA